MARDQRMEVDVRVLSRAGVGGQVANLQSSDLQAVGQCPAGVNYTSECSQELNGVGGVSFYQTKCYT